MARSRNIKPGFFMNETLAECPFEARLLFIGLWTLADREGRLEDRPKRIKAELFPFDSFDVDPLLARLQSDGFLVRYEVDGQRFIQIENFVKHQDPHYKERASEIPAPAGRDNLILASGVTRTQRARIYERDGYKCMACGAVDSLCIDHILPVSRGGTSADDNLQTLCSSCNTKKGNKLDGEGKNSRQRRINVAPNLSQRNGASPSDSLIPDSGFLIPDSKDSGAHTAAEAVDNSERALSGFQPTKAGTICRAMRAAGMAQTNPGDPRLLALIEQGATEAEFVGIAGEAAAGGKGWAWVLKVLQARRADAAAIALAPAEPVKHWTETSTGIIAKGKELGLGEPNPLEQFPVYRARVLKAANVVTQ